MILKDVPARLASLILFLVESEGVQMSGEIGSTHPLHPRAPGHHDRGQ